MNDLNEAQTKLVAALELAGAPAPMVQHAREGLFDDYKSPEANPIGLLVEAAGAIGLNDIADRAMKGDFDGTKADSDAWAASEEGRAVFRELGDRDPDDREAEKIAARKTAEKAEYWATKGQKKERPTAGGTLLCGRCADFALTHKNNPQAQAAYMRIAMGGPWVNVGSTPDGQTLYRHDRCPQEAA